MKSAYRAYNPFDLKVNKYIDETAYVPGFLDIRFHFHSDVIVSQSVNQLNTTDKIHSIASIGMKRLVES